MKSPAQAKPNSRWDPVQLVDRYQVGIWRYLRAMGCDESLADDLTQETFFKVLQHPFDDYNSAATGTYLRRVARNLYITVQRRAGKVVPVADIQQLERSWQVYIRDDSGDELIEALRECLGKLTPRARSALEMRFAQRLPRVEIARALQVTEHGARNLMQRAKQRLKECIKRKTYEH